ncbi:MAG TPA: nuclear transport factor 2 family protein [Acidimicrobiia bacterium]|nr:nuclear transport factor 2 family protein [Acidimicrobiia bacterium]
MLVDQLRSVRQIEDRLARTEDPRQRGMLETVAAHLRAEAASDLDGLRATLVDDPDYHLWADGHDYGPKGMDAVLGYYGDVVAVKRQVLEFDIERIVVDHDTVVTEGWIHAINLGAVARSRGWDVDDDEASYLVSQRVVIFWPFDEQGRMLGEDGYANFDRSLVRKLDPSELPEAYTRLFAPA